MIISTLIYLFFLITVVGINIILHIKSGLYLWKRLVITIAFMVLIAIGENYYLNDFSVICFTVSLFVLSVIWANLIEWENNHPDFYFSGTFWCMVLSISTAIILVFLSFPFFIYLENSTDVKNYSVVILGKSTLRSIHFSINTLLTGAFQNEDSIAYAIVGFHKNNYIHFFISIIMVLVAPFFTLAWIISVFDTDALLYFRLMLLRSSKRKSFVFYKPSEKHLALAIMMSQQLKYDIKYKNAIYGFCRCGKNHRKIPPEIRSGLRAINHSLLLSNTEKDYVFSEKNTTYFVWSDDHASIKKYFEDIKDSNSYSKTVILISNEDMDFLKGRISDNRLSLITISIWKITATVLYKDIAEEDNRKMVLVYGKGSFFEILLDLLSNNSDIGTYKGKETVPFNLQTVIFPDNFFDFFDISHFAKKTDFVILNPLGYKSESIELELCKYIANNRNEEIGIVIAFDDVEKNIIVKRRIVQLIKKLFSEVDIKMYVLCDDEIKRSKESEWDYYHDTEKDTKYYGDEKTSINDSNIFETYIYSELK